MSITWRDGPDLVPARPDTFGWARVAARGVPVLLLLAFGLTLKLSLRPVESCLWPSRRPFTPWITVMACRGTMRLLGLRSEVIGRPLRKAGAMVANHSSWLDIFALNAQARVVFVSKAEVAGWPGIGLLARATGTLFIRRDARTEAAEQARAVSERLGHGEMLMFFPEGTSTDGRRVLPFKPALFAGLLSPGLPEGLSIQPVTLSWEAPQGEDPRFYAWWGGMDFGPHVLAVLATRRPGRVRIVFHPPIPVEGRDRKSLAVQAEAAVRAAL